MGCGSSAEALPPGVVLDTTYEKQNLRTIKELGKGASCFVLKVKHNNMDKELALKKMYKNGGLGGNTNENRSYFENECEILTKLANKNVEKVVHHWEDQNHFNILMELCSGGELYERIIQKTRFTEKDAAKYCVEMLEALKCCHDINIVHRDLKPENLVFRTADEDSELVLIDFGCALQMEDETQVVDDVAGTPYYVAPEVLDDSLDRTVVEWKKADVWSMGIIFYVLLTGALPFTGKSVEDIFRSIRHARLVFPDNCKLSNSAKDLIMKMLNKNYKQRPTVEGCLDHPWMIQAEETEIESHIIRDLETFVNKSALRKAVGAMLQEAMATHHHEALRALFDKFDKDKTGQLTAAEVSTMLCSLGHSANEAESIMKGRESISLEDMEQAEQLASLANDENRIETIFRQADKDKSGGLSRNEVHDALGIDENTVRAIFEETKHADPNSISYQEFVRALNGKGISGVMQYKVVHQRKGARRTSVAGTIQE